MNFVEAAPSAAAWARAVPSIAALRPGFTAPGAVALAGRVDESGLRHLPAAGHRGSEGERVQPAARLPGQPAVVDLHARVPRPRRADAARRDQRPHGARHSTTRPTPSSTCRAASTTGCVNEFKVGYNAPKAEIRGLAPTVDGIDFSALTINLTGSIANTGIAGQSASSGIVVPGGLVRANSATNGRGLLYDPYSLAVLGRRVVGARQPPDEDRRRGPDDPDGDRPAGRHDLHVPERHRVPGQPAVGHPVCRRHQRPERVQQRRHRPAPHRAAVLHAVRAGRMARVVEPDPELRAALRVLHAAARCRTTWSSSSTSTPA